MKQLTLPTYKSLIYKVLWTMGQGGHGKNVNPDSRLRFPGQNGVRRIAETEPGCNLEKWRAANCKFTVKKYMNTDTPNGRKSPQADPFPDNELLFGIDPTPGIVAVSFSPLNSVQIYTRSPADRRGSGTAGDQSSCHSFGDRTAPVPTWWYITSGPGGDF